MNVLGISRWLLNAIFVRFVLAGAIGFVVDAGVLHLLMVWLGASPIVGRCASFLCASLVTWRINRSFTFRQGTAAGWLSEWMHYLWASSVGAMVNYSVFVLLVVALPLVTRLPTLGVGAGSLAGLAINFMLYKRVVFANSKFDHSIADIQER